jgi:hypothetical protein
MKKHRSWSAKILWIILIISLINNIANTRKIRPDKVFVWDIKSYYAYLPAAVIHGDLHLEFLKEKDSKYNSYFWPSTLENGNKLIITSMGLSMLYSPFFMTAHLYASLSSYEANGYTHPYAFALIYSILFYVMLGLFFLRKILLQYFDDFTTTLTLIAIYFGTNLFYYSLYIPMSHAYNFALYAVFIWFTIKWYKSQTYKYSILLGLIYGLLSLIRPTNAIIILVFLLYDIHSFKQLGNRAVFFIKKWKYILLIILITIAIWIPQMLYWKEITGHFIYYSYGVKKDVFFWNNPQISDTLFSFRKGWLLYTPLMFLALLGIGYLFKKYKAFLVPILVIIPIFIYVQSSWWSWWFGGGFGNRAFVDLYGLLAIPLAAFIQNTKNRYSLIRFGAFSFLIIFVLLNIWNTMKYNRVSIHYYWNSSFSYLENLFHLKPNDRYWRTIPYPDYEKAREGVFVAENLIERYNGNYNISPQLILSQIKSTIDADNRTVQGLIKRNGITIDSAKDIVARNIYEQNYSLNEYIEPIEQKLEQKFKDKYENILLSLAEKHNLNQQTISVDINYPHTADYVYTENSFTKNLLKAFYKSELIDTTANGSLFAVKNVKNYCIITDDMENKKRKLTPITCIQQNEIILPERVFEECFTGDWAVKVGNSLDKSLRIKISDTNSKFIYLSFWKKGKSEIEILGNTPNNGNLFINKSKVKGHWTKTEVLVKLNESATQPIHLIIQSKDNKNFIADDLEIYLLNN